MVFGLPTGNPLGWSGDLTNKIVQALSSPERGRRGPTGEEMAEVNSSLSEDMSIDQNKKTKIGNTEFTGYRFNTCL